MFLSTQKAFCFALYICNSTIAGSLQNIKNGGGSKRLLSTA